MDEGGPSWAPGPLFLVSETVMNFTKTRNDEQRARIVCVQLTDEELGIAQHQKSRFERKRLYELGVSRTVLWIQDDLPKSS